MAAEGGMLEPISEKIIHGEIENIRFDHIPKIKEAEGSPEQTCDDTLIKTEVSKPQSLQSFEILRDGQNQPSPAAVHDNGIIIDEAKGENMHQVTTETVDTAGGQIFNVAPSGVQISLDDNCKAGFQAGSDKEEEKEMPKSANINPIASDEVSKEDGPASDEGKEHRTVSEVPPKSSQDVDVEEDEGEDNEGMTEEEIIEKRTSEPEISEKPTSEIEVKLMEDSQTEHEDVSFTAAMKDAGEEPPTKEEETIDKVDLVPIEESATTLRNTEIISDNQIAPSLDDTETTENVVRALGENQNLEQDVNTAAEEEPKTHELTPASIEERVGEEDKQKESFNAALKEPGVETEDANEEEEETTEGDTSVQRSATELQDMQLPIDKSPTPSTIETPDSTEAQGRETEEEETSGQRTTSELPQLQSTIEKSPVHISTPISEHVTHSDTSKPVVVISEERVGEDEKHKESSNSEKWGPGAETQEATEEQDKTTMEGDASAQLPLSELHHLPEKSSVPSKSEDQLDIDGARASTPDYTEEKLEESPNVESAQPCTQTQDSTEEQEETEEGDVSSHMSTGENLSIENQPAGISTLTAEAPLQEDEVKELPPALLGDRIGDDEKPIETSNVAPDIPVTETEDSVEEQQKAIEEGDALQKSASEEVHSPLPMDKPLVPSTIEDQLKTDDARELSPDFIKENVKEEENLKESNNSETGEPGTEAQDAAEEQDKTTAEGDASTQLSASELHHLPTEKSSSPSKTEDQLDIDGARELAPDYSEDQMREEKLEESPNVESAEPGAKTQDSTEEQEETDEGDVSAHMSTDENLSIENHPVEVSTSTAEAPPQEDEAKELAPALTEDRTEEDETLIETTNVSLEIPATETEESVSDQEKATEEGNASLQKSASEELHLPLQIEKSQGPSTSEDQLEIGDARELAPGFAKAHVKEEETLKESTNEETGKPGTETQDATEEQNKTTQLPMSELHHLPEKSPLPSKTEDQLDIDGARESAPDYTQVQVIEEEKLEESSNVESAQPCAQTQSSTEEQEETEEGDVSSHISTGEDLSIENHPAGISTSTAEALLQGDEVEELEPVLLEDRIGDDEKPIETSNVAPEIPATETEDSVEEQEKATEEGDASLQKSPTEELHSPMQIDKPPVPPRTEDQLKTDDARELAPGFIKENVKEEENLKESNNSETGEPGTETQDAAEEQDKTTEEGDASTQLSASELHHFPTEKSPLASKTEDQLDIDGARELAPDYTEDQMTVEKLEESPNVESAEPGTKTQDITEEQEETDEGDVSAHMSTGEHLSMKTSAVGISTSTTEAQLQKDDVKGFVPALTEERTEEDET
ncbi:hypothetical protein IHE45_17G116400 [Dioscorea alata]|uniref:Uncharacterized protein n=1 Tax=Dioscorea alata TaxID=55571 RepID=A0ACB7UES6_DIOAL|nr:hypothetical protein IHE45_17G116400 [Dioscorea alata]